MEAMAWNEITVRGVSLIIPTRGFYSSLQATESFVNGVDYVKEHDYAEAVFVEIRSVG